MCCATRYPEAIPLRTITAKAVTKALIKFFTTFGLPKVLQLDQGSNFMSRLLRNLSIQHQVSSPSTRKAKGRWHQTLKGMLRKYCRDTQADWDEGVPLVFFAVRETVQESLGFSPADLVFGHTPRGPLQVLKENILSADTPTGVPRNVFEYVHHMRNRLHDACAIAQGSLSSAQKRIRQRYDKSAVSRGFKAGDQVLVLLPVQGSSLSAR